MGLWDDLKAMLRREVRDAREWVDDSVGDGHRALDEAEGRLSADPDERLQATLRDIERNDDAFASLQQKADAAAARPAAEAELADGGEEGDGPGADEGPDSTSSSSPT